MARINADGWLEFNDGRRFLAVVLDYETYYLTGKKAQALKMPKGTMYSLRSMATSEYVRDKRFKAHMVSVKVGNQPTKLVPPQEIGRHLKSLAKTHGVKANQIAMFAHNNMFDGLICSHHYKFVPGYYGCTLSMARALHGSRIRSDLDTVASFYKRGNKMPNVLDEMDGMRDLPPELFLRGGAYCVSDTELCRGVLDDMLVDFPEDELDLIHMTVSAFADPVLRVDTKLALEVHAEEVARRKKLFRQVFNELEPERKFADDEELVAYATECLGKAEFLAQALTDLGIEPPMKYSLKQKKMIYAFAKGDEEFAALADHPDELVAGLVEARLAVKSTLNITRALRLYDAGREPGWRLPVGYKYYGSHCVPEDTEVLTEQGWQRIDQWQGGHIAQVDAAQGIQFLPAERFVGPVENIWLQVDAPYLICDFTLGHTMPCFTQKSHLWQTVPAGEFTTQTARKVPLAGVLRDAGTISASQMRVLAMVQADGSFETDTSVGRRMTVYVKKSRKIERARQLLTAAGVPFSEQEYPSKPGYIRFIVRHEDYPPWLRPERKLLGSWLLDSTPEAREALMDELVHWDGNEHNGQVYYSTSEMVNADWVVTLAHLTGRCASINTKPAKGNRRANYSVAIRQRSFGMVMRKHCQEVHRPMRTFCTITQTGFWLARRSGRIFITGNTGRWSGTNKMNLQNLPRGGKLRRTVQAPSDSERLNVLDSSQIEARVNAWISGAEWKLAMFRENDVVLGKSCKVGKNGKPLKKAKFVEILKNADPIVFATDLEDGWELVKRGPDAYRVAYARSFAKLIDDVTKDERQIGKVMELALGYQGAVGAFKSMAKNYGVRLPDNEVKKLVTAWRRANKEIVKFWADCQKVIEDMFCGRNGKFGRNGLLSYGAKKNRKTGKYDGYIDLPNGMQLKYHNLSMELNQWNKPEYSYLDPIYGQKKIYGGLICENVVQALARIVVSEQLLRIWREVKRRVVMTTHDEGVFVSPAAKAREDHIAARRIFFTPPKWAPDLPVAGDGGWALEYSK